MLNILSVAVFICQIRNKTAPLTFSGSFKKISHGYPTLPLFKSKLKLKLLSFSNEIAYFYYISAVSSQNPADVRGLDDNKAIVAFCESFLVSKTNMNLII